MKNFMLKYDKLIISYAFLLIIPFIATLFFAYETGTNNIIDISLKSIIKDIIFIYSYISTGWMMLNGNFISIIFTIIYNAFIVLFLYNISNFTKKYLCKIVFIFSIILTLYGYLSLGFFMSV